MTAINKPGTRDVLLPKLLSTFARVATLAAVLLGSRQVLLAASSPVRVTRAEGVVEIDNGMVKARFTIDKNGVKQEYLLSTFAFLNKGTPSFIHTPKSKGP